MLTGLRFHHVGVACRDIVAEQVPLELLGYRTEAPPFTDPLQRVRGQFMVLDSANSPMRIELLEPAERDSPLEPFLARGGGMYHQCLEAPDFPLALAELKAAGCLLARPPVPAVAFDGRLIAFVMSRTGRLIEILQAADACAG